MVVVDVDVGGTRFRTLTSTLRKSPLIEALLRNMSDDTIGVQRNCNGELFVDRDPELFRVVLEYMRSDIQINVASELEANRLVKEFQYFGFTASASIPKPQKRTSEYASVSIRWRSDGSAAVVYTSAPERDLDHLEEEEEEEEEEYRTRDNSHYIKKKVSVDNLKPHKVAEIMATQTQKLSRLGFVPVSHSESSAMTPVFQDLNFSGLLPFAGKLSWQPRYEDLDPEDAYEMFGPPDKLPENIHWVSETATFVRHISKQASTSFEVNVSAPLEHTQFNDADHLEFISHLDVSGSTQMAQDASNSPSRPAPTRTDPELSTTLAQASATNFREEFAIEEATKPNDAEMLQQQSADISEAILLSKIEAPSGLECAIMRLTHHSESIRNALAASTKLADSCARVKEAGCEVAPQWANGALLLVPCAPESFIEDSIELKDLKPHHIVALASEVELITSALAELPRRQRPKCKLDVHLYVDRPAVSNVDNVIEDIEGHSPIPDPSTSVLTNDDLAPAIIVERTFIHIRPVYGDDASLVNSAPCGIGMQPSNPRRHAGHC